MIPAPQRRGDVCKEVKQLPYCLYLRKSRADLEAEAHGEEETLARHEKALLELSRRLKLNITEIHREIVSGDTIAARPVMQQLLTEVEQGAWDGVLVMEVERLARGDTIDQGIVAQTFKFSGTKIITPLKTYDPTNEYDEEYFEFGLFMSRREYKTINRRLQRGRVASVKEGKFVGNKTPYGYIRKKLEHEKGFTLAPDPAQAPIAKMIFEWYAYGLPLENGERKNTGVARIVRKLNNLKVPPPRGDGDAWVNATLQEMLRNPVYVGKIRWNARPQRKKMVDGNVVEERPRAKASEWILAEGLHKALINQKTWDLVQAKLLEHPTHPGPKQTAIVNPLSGLIICGKCGRRMVRRPYTNRDYPDTLMCPVTSCDNISAPLALVEARVLDALRQWLAQYKTAYSKTDTPSSSVKNKKAALQAAKLELTKQEKQRDNIYDLLEKGIYSSDIFVERSKAIGEKIQNTEERIKNFDDEISQEESIRQSQKTIIPRAEQVLKEYPGAETPAEKNALLKSVIEKIVYTKNVNGRWHGHPGDFKLTLYPKLPKETKSH